MKIPFISRRTLYLFLPTLLWFALTSASRGMGQLQQTVPAPDGGSIPQVSQPGSTVPGKTRPGTAASLDYETPAMRERLANERNADRQKQLEADTKKLVQLANQLQSAVNKSNKNTLSLDVVHSAEQIQKLAKHIQQEMTGP
ncbi:MAG TPA: hypothetical protein VMU62_02080 [Acidobacteriaceae bacterium]|nr:hypothetical protein [Acidobacteriaceae bacterium]